MSLEEDTGTYREMPEAPLHRRKMLRRNSKRMAICNPRKRAPEEIKLAGILILGFQAPELRENYFPLCKPPNLCGILLQQSEMTNIHLNPPLQKTPTLQNYGDEEEGWLDEPTGSGQD